jgi:hypothetical protein
MITLLLHSDSGLLPHLRQAFVVIIIITVHGYLKPSGLALAVLAFAARLMVVRSSWLIEIKGQRIRCFFRAIRDFNEIFLFYFLNQNSLNNKN